MPSGFARRLVSISACQHFSLSAFQPVSISACQLSPAQALADWLTSGSEAGRRADYRRGLEALAGSHVHVGDVDQRNTGREGLLYALGEDLGGDARVGEVAV
jgi:hypothetical protein